MSLSLNYRYGCMFTQVIWPPGKLQIIERLGKWRVSQTPGLAVSFLKPSYSFS